MARFKTRSQASNPRKNKNQFKDNQRKCKKDHGIRKKTVIGKNIKIKMGKKRIITSAGGEPTDQKSAASQSKKISKKQVINGVAYIKVSYNNTLVTIADGKGEVVAWSSAGSMGFKGTKKSTPYAANIVARDCLEKAKKYNLTDLKIVVRGIGPGRESAIRGLANAGINITSIMDATPVAHNGVKPPKPRRV